jgi:long-chain acyl-CoA synthetase
METYQELKINKMQVTRTFDLLDRYEKEFTGKQDVFAAKIKGQWVKYSVRDYIDASNHISFGLLALGLHKGDRIATISNNRPDPCADFCHSE